MSVVVHLFKSALAKKAAILLAALAGAMTVTGAVGQVGSPLTVTPIQGSQLTDVVVSGSDCRGGSPSSVVGALAGPPGTGSRIEGTPFETAAVGSVFTATPDAGGNWTASFTVPPFIAAGQYEVRAICKSDPNASTGAEYQPRPFTVLAATSPELSVSPREARAGQDVRLSVSGTLCLGPEAVVDVGVFERVPESVGAADEFVARATFRPNPQGVWEGSLLIPARARPGTYGVGATCERGGVPRFNYLPVPNVVLTAAAVPTQAPRLTLTG